MNALQRLAVLIASVVFVRPIAAQKLQLCPALGIGTLGVTVATGEANRPMFKKSDGASYSPARTRARTAALTFRPSQAVRKRIVEAFVRDANRNDPATAQKMRDLFARQDPVVSIGNNLAKLGLRKDNPDTGMTVYLVQCWYGAHGTTASGAAVYQAVSRQAADVFASNPALAQASDATKQEAAEALIFYGALFEEAIEKAKQSQPELLPRLRAAIAAHARGTLGFDLNALRLDASGFH